MSAKKLADLEPEWVRYEANHPRNLGELIHHVNDLSEAQGLMFLCPHCGCTQQMTFRDRGVQDHQGSHNREGLPSRWSVAGTGIEDLTLTPSIDSGCGWHGFITHGEATNA